jgi:septal ring factor EnvC (AmiA/AmiB activator)
LQAFCNLGVQLEELRQEGDAVASRRTIVEEEIAQLNKTVSARSEQIACLEGKLKYKNEKRIADAVKRLHVKLNSGNVKPSERRKVLAEIDQLNLSRKFLEEYNSTKVRHR